MKTIQYIIILMILIACEQDTSLNIPVFDTKVKEYTSELTNLQKGVINGIYTVNINNRKFGDSLVLKWNADRLSVFCGKNSAYMILEGGHSEGRIILEGYWRFAESDETGLIHLEIDSSGEAGDILSGNVNSNIKIEGYYADEAISTKKEISLEYSVKLKENNDYWIIAHRGGGRNADLLPHSENSLELIRMAESLGANAVEIDVQMTKDNVPVLYHDKNLNTRLINGEYMVGPVKNYYLYQLRNFCTLKNGEQMPTLEEALETIVSETNISLVWLDIKSVSALDHIFPLIDKYKEKSEFLGRSVLFYPGIPTDDILAAFRENENFRAYPSICELSTDDAADVNAAVWAPRWTLGLQVEKINHIHSQDKKAVVWTVDDVNIMREFIRESNFDGMVTNFPAMAAYEYYTK